MMEWETKKNMWIKENNKKRWNKKKRKTINNNHRKERRNKRREKKKTNVEGNKPKAKDIEIIQLQKQCLKINYWNEPKKAKKPPSKMRENINRKNPMWLKWPW